MTEQERVAVDAALVHLPTGVARIWRQTMLLTGVIEVNEADRTWAATFELPEPEPAPVEGALVDRFGNRFFKVGDLVTRDGTDIHRVVEHNGSDGYAPDAFTVVCVKAPAGGWCKVGDEEFNICRRYEWIGDAIDA
ncbi:MULTISPECIES: hypothetical protein [unclassified Methylobacterium]|jgi:hypothetical protein|uniref:hypothetical protein n=1 Tax=unclassified Methylobacterium TaxID=2615210 RepID=UPI0013527EBB|nr:hypothetical protein [Methylobacterium sp. 2A]MWV22413.1 hypothetical protein [Methylobacterium sp. 2A]